MNPLLFVYGSLLTALDHPMGRRLRAEAALLGPATVRGRLYRVSWYPGFVPGGRDDDVVHGEVYRMADPTASLAWLDEYEGIARGALSAGLADEYVREEIDARLPGGAQVRAWVYVYRRALPESSRVTDGLWRG